MTDTEILMRENKRLRGDLDHKDTVIAELIYEVKKLRPGVDPSQGSFLLRTDEEATP